MKHVGRTTGKTFNQFCTFLFTTNERRAIKWTDGDIVKFLKDEFKGTPLKVSQSKLTYQRSIYNLGLVTREFPRTRSFRYAKDGTVLSSHGNPMTQESVRQKLYEHQQRVEKHCEPNK